MQKELAVNRATLVKSIKAVRFCVKKWGSVEYFYVFFSYCISITKDVPCYWSISTEDPMTNCHKVVMGFFFQVWKRNKRWLYGQLTNFATWTAKVVEFFNQFKKLTPLFNAGADKRQYYRQYSYFLFSICQIRAGNFVIDSDFFSVWTEPVVKLCVDTHAHTPTHPHTHTHTHTETHIDTNIKLGIWGLRLVFCSLAKKVASSRPFSQ